MNKKIRLHTIVSLASIAVSFLLIGSAMAAPCEVKVNLTNPGSGTGEVTATQSSTYDWIFSGWSGSTCSGNNPCVVEGLTSDQPKEVIGTFNLPTTDVCGNVVDAKTETVKEGGTTAARDFLNDIYNIIKSVISGETNVIDFMTGNYTPESSGSSFRFYEYVPVTKTTPSEKYVVPGKTEVIPGYSRTVGIPGHYETVGGNSVYSVKNNGDFGTVSEGLWGGATYFPPDQPELKFVPGQVTTAFVLDQTIKHKDIIVEIPGKTYTEVIYKPIPQPEPQPGVPQPEPQPEPEPNYFDFSGMHNYNSDYILIPGTLIDPCQK
ncbi:MAG: hypothetical protein AAB621_03480 [Patescibacteria group bacterium]